MKRTIPLITRLAILMITNMLFANSSKASHTMGADLTYECLGGNTYKITLSFYRDCIGIPAPTNPFVKVISSSCAQNNGVTCYPRPGTGQEVTPACSSSVTTCNGGSFTGIQEWIYDGIITLPMQCTDWVFSYNLCCRNAAITNITNPGSNTFYIYATLNNTISPHNSSPTFSNKPVPFLCVGQQYCFNHGATDADGDSLSYSLITPKQSASTTVTYISPYTASNPLNSVPTTTFNSHTGDICLTPQSLQVTVMAVLVKEYRNGILIGSVERDLQLTVMNCNNTLPTLTGINGTNNFSMTVCAGQPMCFNIYSNDVDTGQNLTVSWDNGIANSTFTSTAAQHPVSTFCWTPTTADISNTPHVFTVRVADNACPYVGSQIYSYSITVQGITVDAGPDDSIACSDLATLTATASGGSGTYTYLWSNGSTMRSITVGAGTYYVTASDGTCSATDTVNVTMPFTPTANFSSTTPSCLNSLVHFTDLSSTPGGVLDSWYWNFGDSTSSTNQNPVHQYNSPGSYIVTLVVGNSLGCIDSVSQQIVINPLPVAAFTFANTCSGQTAMFTNQSTPPGSVNSWLWNFGDGTFSSSQNTSHLYGSPGSYQVTLIAGDTSSCSDTVSHTITIYSLPIVNAGADQSICSGNSATLTATGGITYSWNPGGSIDSILVVNPLSTTNYTVTATDSNGCSSSDVVTVIINPLPTANAGADKNICIGNSTTLSATGGISYTWNPGGMTTSTITISPDSNTVYAVTVTDVNGCSATDSVAVQVNPLPTATISPVVNICAGSGTTLTAGGGITYNWIPTGSTTSSISVNPASSTTYTVIVSDANGCKDSADVLVSVHTAPVVNLQSFFMCSGSASTLNAGNPGSTYLWSPTGETTQVINIDSGGTYSVMVTDSFGCHTSASCNITMGASLTINMGNISFCQGDSALLDAGHPGMHYLWNPGGETSQTIFVHSAGTYGVTVTDTSGCSGTISSTIQINPLPIADFSATTICVGSSTVFTDHSSISSGSISSWLWNFGDGSISVQQNPTHLFAAAGTYSVSLQITSSAGCIKTINKNIAVNPLPLAGFNFTNSCQNSIVTFQDSSSVISGTITSYLWDFGDGTTSTSRNTSHQYTSPGNYNVSLEVTTAGGCSSSLIKTITVYPLPVAAFSAPSACLGSTTIFSDHSGISTGSINNYSWNFGDGSSSNQQQPNHTYSSPGIHSVTLTVTSNNGCQNIISQPVIINDLPNASAGKDQNICSGSTTTIYATGGTSYNWTPGGINLQSVIVNPASTTTYTVVVTDSNGCQSSDDVVVNVNSLPNVNAGPDQSICIGQSATLSANGGTTYLWFPGGSTSPRISVQPVSTTNYVVLVTDANGCQATDSLQVSVNPLPRVYAGPDQTICNGSTISLYVSGALNYSWSPGGYSGPVILVTPSVNTTYTVIGIDANGCQSSDSTNVFINTVPAINIAPTSICTGSSTTLNAGNTGSTFAWSTGESTQSITVGDTGFYSVVVTDQHNCSTIGNAYVGLSESPVANYTAPDICANSGLSFQDHSSISSGSISGWSWNFGDNTTSSVQNPIHTYPNAGTYMASLTVTSTNGCSNSINSTIHVFPNPIAAFTASNVCFSNATQFINQSSGTGNYSSSWDFNDGTVSQLTDPSHTFTNAGSYNVILQVTTPDGCSDQIHHGVNIYMGPTVSFHANSGCLGTPTVFIDNSSSFDGSITSWSWDFGDGTLSSSSSPSHIYRSDGTFNVSLTTTTSYGCFNTTSGTVAVYPVPDPRIVSSDVCLGSSIDFSDMPGNQSAGTISYFWNLGDNSTSASSQISHTYQTAGTYQVSLLATSQNGCSVEDRTQVTVFPLPNVSFNVADHCYPASTHFNNTSSVASGSIINCNWNFGDGHSAILSNPIHAYAAPGIYQVLLSASSDQGCLNADTEQVRINPSPQVNFGSSIRGCSPLQASFADSSTISEGNINGWTWDFGDGGHSSQQNPSYVFNQSGVFPVTLTVVSNEGCSTSYTIPDFVTVHPSPDAGFTADPGIVDIFDPVVHFNNLSESYTWWSWDFGDGTSTTNEVSPTHTFADTGRYTALLVVLNSYGCRDTAYKLLEVRPHSTLFAPNCFTPNGDGKNDTFKPYFTEMKTIQVWIFNRWGELLTTWEGLDGSWDGYYKGQPCQEDVYIYRITGIGADGKSYEWTGHVSIVH